MAHTAIGRMVTDPAKGFVDVFRGAARRSRQLGADAGETVTQSVAAFMRAASGRAERTKGQAEDLFASAGSENPVASTASVAAAVGLLGYAIARTRHLKEECGAS